MSLLKRSSVGEGGGGQLLRAEDDDLVVVEKRQTPVRMSLPGPVEDRLVLAGDVAGHHHPVVHRVGAGWLRAPEGVAGGDRQVEQGVPVVHLGQVLLQHLLRSEPTVALGAVERSLRCSPRRGLWGHHQLSGQGHSLQVETRGWLRLLLPFLGYHSTDLQVGLAQVLHWKGEQGLEQDGVVGGEVTEQAVVAQEALPALGALEADGAGHLAVQHQGLLQVDLAQVSSQVGLW